jgi:ADP-heptose:LPS heptosyltransferase
VPPRLLGEMAGEPVVPLHPAGERLAGIGAVAEEIADERPARRVGLPPEFWRRDQPEGAERLGGDLRDPRGQETHPLDQYRTGEAAEVFVYQVELVGVEAEEVRGLSLGGLSPQLLHGRVHQAMKVRVARRVGPLSVLFEVVVAGVEGEPVLRREEARDRGFAGAGRAAEPEGVHRERISAVTRPRFLVHQARFHIGDTLWLTPLLRAIHRFFPGARTTVVGPPVALELLAGNPHVEVIVPYLPSPGREREERRRVLGELAGRGFDVALFAFARRPESRWLARAMAKADVPHRINLEYLDPALERTMPPWLTHEAWFAWGAQPSPRMLLHALDPLLVEPATWTEADRRVEIFLSAEARRKAGDLLTERGFGAEPFAILAPGGHSSHRWPARKFARLARKLAGELGLHVLVEGSPGEQELLAQVAHQAGGGRVIAATDPLPVYAALLERASLLVANDSGSIHLAEAAGTPTLYFAQCEKLVHSHPAGERCRALWDEADNRLDSITMVQALAAARELLIAEKLSGRPRPVGRPRSVSPRR